MASGLVATGWSNTGEWIGVRKKRFDIYLAVSDNVEQCDDVWSPREVLEDLDLSLDLLLLDRLKNLDNALLIVGDIDALKDLRVLSTACTSC